MNRDIKIKKVTLTIDTSLKTCELRGPNLIAENDSLTNAEHYL